MVHPSSMDRIEKASVLRGLTKEDLAELCAIADEQEWNLKDCLFRSGEEAGTFYIATRGTFALTVGLRAFDDDVEMAAEEMKPLDAFGWSSLVKPRTSIYSCHCIEPGAVIAFPREQLETLFTTNTRLGEIFLHNLNELIGNRVRVLQKLWLDEVSQSSARVYHFTHSGLTSHLNHAMEEPRSRPVRRWIQKHSHRHIED